MRQKFTVFLLCLVAVEGNCNSYSSDEHDDLIRTLTELFVQKNVQTVMASTCWRPGEYIAGDVSIRRQETFQPGFKKFLTSLVVHIPATGVDDETDHDRNLFRRRLFYPVRKFNFFPKNIEMFYGGKKIGSKCPV